MILKGLLAVVAVLAVAAAAVTAIGYSLPRDHVASREVLLDAGPSEVFAVLGDVGRYPEWRTDVSSVEVLSASPLRWREYSGGDVVTYEVVERDAPTRLRVQIADPDLPFGGTWTHELTPQGEGTRLLITERGEVYNPLFRFMSRFVFGHTATLDRFIAALVRRFQKH